MRVVQEYRRSVSTKYHKLVNHTPSFETHHVQIPGCISLRQRTQWDLDAINCFLVIIYILNFLHHCQKTNSLFHSFQVQGLRRPCPFTGLHLRKWAGATQEALNYCIHGPVLNACMLIYICSLVTSHCVCNVLTEFLQMRQPLKGDDWRRRAAVVRRLA